MKSKEQKRREGEERNLYWRSLTPEQQRVSLMERRGKSVRQLKRITAPEDASTTRRKG